MDLDLYVVILLMLGLINLTQLMVEVTGTPVELAVVQDGLDSDQELASWVFL